MDHAQNKVGRALKIEKLNALASKILELVVGSEDFSGKHMVGLLEGVLRFVACLGGLQLCNLHVLVNSLFSTRSVLTVFAFLVVTAALALNGGLGLVFLLLFLLLSLLFLLLGLFLLLSLFLFLGLALLLFSRSVVGRGGRSSGGSGCGCWCRGLGGSGGCLRGITCKSKIALCSVS